MKVEKSYSERYLENMKIFVETEEFKSSFKKAMFGDDEEHNKLMDKFRRSCRDKITNKYRKRQVAKCNRMIKTNKQFNFNFISEVLDEVLPKFLTTSFECRNIAMIDDSPKFNLVE